MASNPFQLLETIGGQLGASPTLIEYLSRIMHQESGGKANAKNSNSSASGLFQFIDGTWQRVTGLAGSARDYSAETQIEAGIKFAQENTRALTSVLGREPTVGELYLAHFAGIGGAKAVLSADPSASIQAILGDEVVEANASIKFRGKKFAEFTAQDLRDWAETVMGSKKYLEAKARGEAFDPEVERKTRTDLLRGYGYDENQIKGLGDLLSAVVLSLIQFLLGEAMPPGERAQSTGAEIQEVSAGQVRNAKPVAVNQI